MAAKSCALVRVEPSRAFREMPRALAEMTRRSLVHVRDVPRVLWLDVFLRKSLANREGIWYSIRKDFFFGDRLKHPTGLFHETIPEPP